MPKQTATAKTPRIVLIAISMTVLAVSLATLAARSIFPQRYSEYVEREAAAYGLEKEEVYAVIMAESRFDPSAVSRVGACGLMQLMPATAGFCADVLGIDKPDLFDPETNIRLGCFYLNYLNKLFDGDDVYAAYNAGEGNVRLWNESGSGYLFPETAEYVRRIRLYKKIYGVLY